MRTVVKLPDNPLKAEKNGLNGSCDNKCYIPSNVKKKEVNQSNKRSGKSL